MLTQAEFRAIGSGELGKPYIWGASGPEAYDCSGLAQVLLETVNLDPPGDQTAEGLYRFFLRGGRSTTVALADCALGDLIFFGGAATISHVALGWGGGDMIEAGGGGRTTTSAAIARQQGAEVRIRPITRRRDRVAILRPAALGWDSGLELALEAVAGFGRFEGTPLTEWLSDGRHMQLKRPFAYFAEDGTGWPVRAETIVDGTSIPQPFWSLIGGPFEGLYRDASIIHDFYCDTRTRPWRATHRVFYEAMRCSGVGMIKAKVMYYGVYRFGPRWELPGAEALALPAALEAVAVPVAAPLATPAFDAASASADVRAISEADLDLESIEALADARSPEETAG